MLIGRVGQLGTVTSTRSLVDDQKAAAHPGDSRAQRCAAHLMWKFAAAERTSDKSEQVTLDANDVPPRITEGDREATVRRLAGGIR
jgi:hypothetical protein